MSKIHFLFLFFTKEKDMREMSECTPDETLVVINNTK